MDPSLRVAEELALLNVKTLHKLSRIAWPLICVDVPDDVVGESIDTVAGAFGHLREAFRLRLVLESVAWKVDAWERLASVPLTARIGKYGPERCTSALTMMFTPPIPSNCISSSLLFRQSPIFAMYLRLVLYSL